MTGVGQPALCGNIKGRLPPNRCDCMSRYLCFLLAAFAISLYLCDAQGYSEVTVVAPAVAQTSDGWIGVVSYVEVAASTGTGRVFVDTFPLTQIDTQGSARLAAEAAASLAGVDLSKVDLYVVIRSDSAVIGGPSAGATMAVAILASLLNRSVNSAVVMTGTINPDGTIGPIGGVVQKAEAAHSVGASVFLVPRGQTVATETPTSRTLVNVTDYAKQHWNLTVLEADDLRQAARWMIGIDIQPPGGGEQIDLTRYNKVMSTAAQNMLDEAVGMAKRAEEAFDSARLTYSQRNYLSGYVEDFKAKIEDAKKAQRDETYYLSASLSFQAKINATFVDYALQYLRSGTRTTAKRLIEDAEKAAREAFGTVNETSFTSITAFECYAAAQRRADEAVLKSESAWKNYYQSESDMATLAALWDAAYMKERAATALWWVSLCEDFPGELEINRTSIKATAQKYADDLKYLVAYAQSFGEGITSGFLTSAASLQSDVQRQLDNGVYASAILDALRGRSYVNAHLELYANLLSSDEELVKTLLGKVEREKELSRSAVAASRDYGVNPILALSHLESAENYERKVEASGPASGQIPMLLQAFLEYKYARLVAEMSPALSARLGDGEGQRTAPRIEPFNPTLRTIYRLRTGDAMVIGIGCLAIGLAVGLLAGRRGGREKRAGI